MGSTANRLITSSAAIAFSSRTVNYADNPTNTIIVSPDNALRRAINHAVRPELQERGIVESENHSRASQDAQIFTNNLAQLVPQLSTDISKTSAIKVAQSVAGVQGIGFG